MTHSAYCNSAGDIIEVRFAKPTSVEGEGLRSDGIFVKHVTLSDLNLATYMETHYFDWTSETIKSRPTKPHETATWNAGTTSWDITLDNYLIPIRRIRNSKLTQCDWTQIADNGLTDQQKTDWRTYRQSLRDITVAVKATPTPYLSFEQTVAWPAPPS